MEGLPLTFLEAIARKTPVVSLSVDPDGMLGEHQCGFVCDGNMEVLEGRIDELLTHKDLHGRIGNNAFQCARRLYNIETQAGALYDVFKGMC